MRKLARHRNDVRSLLTTEERRVLLLLIECANDEMIARRMIVSVRTVRRRIARILELLGAENRFAAGVAAASLGLIVHPSVSPLSSLVTSGDRPATRAVSDR